MSAYIQWKEYIRNNNFCELLNNSLPIMRNIKKSWLCVKNVNKSLFYVGHILKVISCLANANVLLYISIAGLQVMILQKD